MRSFRDGLHAAGGELHIGKGGIDFLEDRDLLRIFDTHQVPGLFIEQPEVDDVALTLPPAVPRSITVSVGISA
jgi:hypothetical protein